MLDLCVIHFSSAHKNSGAIAESGTRTGIISGGSSKRSRNPTDPTDLQSSWKIGKRHIAYLPGEKSESCLGDIDIARDPPLNAPPPGIQPPASVPSSLGSTPGSSPEYPSGSTLGSTAESNPESASGSAPEKHEEEMSESRTRRLRHYTT